VASAAYWPVPPRFVLISAFAVAVLGLLIAVDVASYAYARLGLDGWWLCAVLLASVLGSWFNIPIARLRGEIVFAPIAVRVFGMTYIVPHWVQEGTKIIAVNVGGALIPTGLSVYLIAHENLGWEALAATAFVTVVVHGFARAIPGVGIVVPTLLPCLAAVLSVWLLDVEASAAVAYVSGTLGTLIGADLLNLRHVRSLQAPVLSIGGAGTFDGIFVTGILSVVLATL
jgi:uncharacterized membrane protein